MAEQQRTRAPESEQPKFEKQRPLDTGDVPQGKHTEPAPLPPIVPGCG